MIGVSLGQPFQALGAGGLLLSAKTAFLIGPTRRYLGRS
jgi:hypothetical protein